MNDPRNVAFIAKATAGAAAAGHIFPKMAAAEAALESAHSVGGIYIFGASELAVKGNNLFGTKQHATPIYTTLWLPTKEHVTAKAALLLKNPVQLTPFGPDGKADYQCDAPWVVYPDWAASFKDRMDTLIRLQNTYPHYKAALQAGDPITYVNQVSQTWSTGEARANSVIKIFNQY